MASTSCGDLLADNFCELCFFGERGILCKERGPPALIWREASRTTAKLSWLSIVKIAIRFPFASLSLAFESLPLLLGFNGKFHRGTSRLLQVVVVVVFGEVSALGFPLLRLPQRRQMDVWSSVATGQSHQGRTQGQILVLVFCCILEYSADLGQHSTLALESSDSVLVEGSRDHHDDPS